MSKSNQTKKKTNFRKLSPNEYDACVGARSTSFHHAARARRAEETAQSFFDLTHDEVAQYVKKGFTVQDACLLPRAPPPETDASHSHTPLNASFPATATTTVPTIVTARQIRRQEHKKARATNVPSMDAVVRGYAHKSQSGGGGTEQRTPNRQYKYAIAAAKERAKQALKELGGQSGIGCTSASALKKGITSNDVVVAVNNSTSK